MRKIHFSRISQLLALAVLGVALVACGGRDEIKRGAAAPAVNAPASYDLTLLCDKDGQFDFDGATIDKQTVRDHVNYMNENGHPVHTILLKRGEKQKVTNEHILALSSIARDVKLTVYVLDNDGKLSVVSIDDNK